MRIALAHSHLETYGGGERAVLEVGRRLAAQHDVRLLVGRYRPDRTYAELAQLPMTRLGRLQWLAARRPEQAIVTNSFGANLLAFRNGPRVVSWVHSVRSRFLQPGASRPDLLVRRALDWLAMRRAARVVANSQFTASRIRQLYGREADAVVYPGVDRDLFCPPSDGRRSGAITVGRIAPEKGMDRLAQLWRELPDLPLTIVGDGDASEVERVRRLAPPNVRFLGAVPPHEVARLYQAASLAVFTPRDEEFGIAAVEAMACGTPVVALRGGGLGETVLDGETGVLAGDERGLVQAVRRLVADELLRERLGAAGCRQAAAYTWERAGSDIEHLCSEVAWS